MAYVLPTIPDFKGQFTRDFPYATPLEKPGLVGAEAVATLNAGTVAGITVTVPGSGYPVNPLPGVIIYGGDPAANLVFFAISPMVTVMSTGAGT